MAFVDRAIPDNQDVQLQQPQALQGLEAVKRLSTELPPGGPQRLIQQRLAEIEALNASGQAAEAQRALRQLRGAVEAHRAVPHVDVLERARTEAVHATPAARHVINLLAERAQEARRSGSQLEIRQAERDLDRATAASARMRTDETRAAEETRRLQEMANDKSRLGYDHLVLSTEAQRRLAQA